jgi:hypothetical protein
MSSIGRLQGGTASLDFTVDLNQASMQSIINQEQKISYLQTEIYGIENEIKNEVIGDMGKVETIDEETGESITTKTSVRQNLETLYEIITGVAAVTDPELAVPLIAFKEIYDTADHLYEQGHSIYEAINNFKNLVGNPHSSGEIHDTDEYGNLLWHDEEQTNPIYKNIPPTGLHARAYDLENMLYKKEWWPNYTKDDTTKFNMLRLENWEEGGEIHFITRIANDYNGVEFGTFQEKKQYYNTKIGANGKLYCWYKRGYIPDPTFTWDNEWIDITDKIANNSFQNLTARIDITILQAAVFGIGGTQALAGTTKETIQVGAYTLWETIKGTFTVSAAVIGGTLAGYYVANRNKEDLQKANKYLEDQLIKIANKEVPYDALTDEDLAELEQAYIDKIQEGINEIKELDKQNINEIGFLHSDLLTDSKFEIDDTNKLVSSDLNHLVDNVGIKATDGTSTLLFKDVEDIITDIGIKNNASSTGIHKNIYDIFNLIGNKTLTTPPKDPSGILGNIEEIQELLGISDDTETGETTLISRIETNENDISTIQGDITTINGSITDIETELGTSGDGTSINSKITNLQTYTGITDPLPTKSLKEQIDSIRDITGYDDSSLLYLLLPPNQDGTIPSIQENTINNDSLIHLGYKGTALKENFSDYFILYVMPHYSISTEINSVNRYLVRDLVSNKEPSESGLQIQNATDEYVSALTGYFIYDQIYLNNDWYFSIYLKNLQAYNNILYRYNNIEVLINLTQLVVSYKKYITSEIHYLDNVWTDGLQINIVNYFGRNSIVRFTNTYSYYQNHSLTFLSANPNRQLSDYYNMFIDNGEYQKGFNMYPFKNSSGDYIVYHTGANFAPLSEWKISIARNWTKPALVGGETIYIRIFIMATNTLPSSYANFTMIYESDVKSLSQAQYTSTSTFTLNTGNNTGYNYWLIGYIYTNSAGNLITDHDTRPLMIGKLRQLYVGFQQAYQNNEIISNHNITFDNDFKHLALNDRVETENKIVYYANGIEKGTINIPSDRVLSNDNTFLLGGTHTYRAFGIGNGILTTENLNEISQLSKTNYRVRIPELTVMDEVYITDTLILENDIQFRNRADGTTFNYYTETDSSGLRRRQGIQEDGAVVDSFTYTDELIFRTTPTQNQFLFYNIATGQFEGVNTTNFYTKADIDGKGYLTSIPSEYITETELNSKGYLTSIPTEYITETELNSKGYLTTIPGEYITETELNSKGYLTSIPTEYITETELNSKGYLTSIPTEYITETELNSKGYLTSIPTEYITETELNSKGYLTSIPTEYITETELNGRDFVDTTELDSRNYVSYDDFAKNQASEINPGIVKYNDITEKFYTVNKIEKEDVNGLIDTIQNIPNVYTIAETFPVLNHLILDEYFQVSPVEYLELYVKYDDFTYTLAPHLYIQYTYLGNTYYKSTYDTTAINIHKHDIIRFVKESIASDNEALYTHQYYFKNELGNIMTNDGGLPKKYLDTTMNWVQDTDYPLNYQIQLYRSNRDDTNELLLATFKIIDQSYDKQFKPEVLPKIVQDITKINNNLQIDYSDTTNTTITILDNSLVKDIQVSGGFLNYTQLDDTVISRTLPFVENDVDSVLTFFEGATFTRNSANKIDLLEIDTFNENIIINGSASYGSGSIQLNCENNTHNVKIIAPAHSTFSGGNYSLTLPADLGTTGQVLSITPNSLTRDGRLFWTNRINIFDFNESQFENVSGKISIIPSVLGSGGGGGVSISDFNPTQFETNPSGEITIIDSVLGSGGGGGVVDYDEINVPYESQQTTSTETVNVIASVSPEYISQTTITEYTVLDADAEHLRVHWKFDNAGGTYNNTTALFENSAPNPITGLTFTSLSSHISNGVYSTTDKVLGSGSLYKSNPSEARGYKITPANWLSQNFNTSKQATFAFWVKNTEGSSPYQHIFRQDQSFIIRQNGNDFHVYVSSADAWSTHDVVSSPVFTLNTWVHIVVTINLTLGTNNNDVVKVYQNGIELNTTVSGGGSYPVGTGFVNDSSDFRFIAGGGGTNAFKGYLDDFRIYDKALTATEIGYLANNMVKLEPQPVYENPEYKTLTFTHQLQCYPPASHLKDDTTDPTGEITTYTHNVPVGASYGAGDYIITTSSSDSYNYLCADKLFSDKTDTDLNRVSFEYNQYHYPGDYETASYSLGGFDGDWVKVQFPESKVLQKMRIYIQTQLQTRAPGVFKIFGSNDGSSWNEIYHQSTQLTTANYIALSGSGINYPFSSLHESNIKYYEFNIYNDTNYLHYAMVVNKITGDDRRLDLVYLEFLMLVEYELTFDNPTECDILIVGGGGSGGGSLGGGGGGGGVLFATFDSIPAGSYNIKVGKGGDRVQSDSAVNSGLGPKLGITGTETEFEGTIVYGGGGGGDYRYHAGLSGGSGGGGGFQTASGGIKTLPTYGSFITTDNSTYYGNDGESVSNASKSGDGGSANFTSDISGTNYIYSTGGTGRINGNDNSITNDDGVNYGDGGGGGGWSSTTYSGKGADGIVIIRYKTTYDQTITVGADIKPKGIMTHTDAGWQLIDMTDFSIIQALVSEITLLKQRLNALEATPTPTNTIVWSYRYFDTTTDITINDGTIIQLDNTRVKHKVSIKITYISDFVPETKTYQATLEISGAQYGGFDILSVPTIINEVNESSLPTGAPVNYIYQVVEDSIVIGSKTIELYRPPGDVELKLTYRITTSSSNQVFSTDSDPVVNIPTGTW